MFKCILHVLCGPIFSRNAVRREIQGDETLAFREFPLRRRHFAGNILDDICRVTWGDEECLTLTKEMGYSKSFTPNRWLPLWIKFLWQRIRYSFYAEELNFFSNMAKEFTSTDRFSIFWKQRIFFCFYQYQVGRNSFSIKQRPVTEHYVIKRVYEIFPGHCLNLLSDRAGLFEARRQGFIGQHFII